MRSSTRAPGPCRAATSPSSGSASADSSETLRCPSKDWRPWDGEIKSGHFWMEDIRGVRAELLARGHHPRVSLRNLCEWSALRLRVQGGADWVIRELCEDAEVLQQWRASYRGQRLAGASLEVFLYLLQGRRDDTRSRREELLSQQQGMCKLCGAPIALGTFEIDHVIPVSQSFSGQQQELQALCLECHRTKTSLEGNRSTTLESRFSRYAYQNYAASPRLPPLVFQLQKWDDTRPCQGIDVCRCRKNGLANARRCPSSALWTASSPRKRASSRTSPGSTCPATTARACWIGCPTWGGAGSPSPHVPTCSRQGSPSGSTSSGAWTPQHY